MFELQQRVNPSEVIVGWYVCSLAGNIKDISASAHWQRRYASGNDITEHSTLIHEFYAREQPEAQIVHVLVDTTLNGGRMNVQAVVG